MQHGSRNRSSHSATQPLSQSGWTSHSYQSVWVAELAGPATLTTASEWLSGWVAVAEWLEQPLSHSATLAERLSGWSSHSYQSVCQSGCSSHSATLPEWLGAAAQPLSHSARAAEWLSGCTKPLWQNVSVGEYLVQLSQWRRSSITKT